MAKYPTDATYTSGATTYTMANRKPDRGYQTTQQFNTAVFTSQVGYERRRQISRRPKRQFSITYTNINGAYKQAIENFFKARGGDFDSFEFDLSYVGQNGTIQVRFDSQLSVTEVQTTSALVTNIYTVSFTLIESFT